MIPNGKNDVLPERLSHLFWIIEIKKNEPEEQNIRDFHIEKLLEQNIFTVNGKVITQLSDLELLLAYDEFVFLKGD